METVLKYKSPSGREIFFEPKSELPNGFIEGKQYMNSVYLENGTFEFYAFNSSFVVSATESEKDMFQQLKDRSIYLIGK